MKEKLTGEERPPDSDLTHDEEVSGGLSLRCQGLQTNAEKIKNKLHKHALYLLIESKLVFSKFYCLHI